MPDTWLTWLTHRSVLNQNAILMVVALGLLVPLAAGVFDLSIAGTISASAVMVSWGMVEARMVDPGRDRRGARWSGLIVGNINGFLVVKIQHRLVHRHARHELDADRVRRVAVEQPLDPRLPRVVQIARHRSSRSGSTRRCSCALVVGARAVVRARAHRRSVATCSPPAAPARQPAWPACRPTATCGARSSPRRCSRRSAACCWPPQFGSTQAQSGSPYLLPAFAAAFLGSTQFKRRFNVWGAVLAVFVLQSGVKGLQLAGVGTTWIESLFFGVALIVAVGFSSYRKRVHGGQRRWWRREESGPEYFLGTLLGLGQAETEQSKQNAEEWWFDPNDSEGHHIKPTEWSRSRSDELESRLPTADEGEPTVSLVGAKVLRKEDPRLLSGAGHVRRRPRRRRGALSPRS